MERLAKLRNKLQEKELDAVLVLGSANRRYLSGFTGSGGYAGDFSGCCSADYRFSHTEQAAVQAPEFLRAPVRVTIFPL